MVNQVHTDVLRIAYAESGNPDGPPVVLLHGFPYDIHAYDDVVPVLIAAGCRVVVPYLRGFGPTRFLSAETPRSGQQAALAHDLLDLMDGLGIERAVLAGYDWGGRAACIVAALWPERVHGLVTGAGYNIQHIPSADTPQPPELEMQFWYQYYFHGERGRQGLARYRRELCHLLWRLWSPNWRFDEATFARTAASFDNPDFVEVVIHSYRHRFGLVDDDPAYEATEERLTHLPRITVPAIVLHGSDNGVIPAAGSVEHHRFFGSAYDRRLLPKIGHNLPQEAPQEFAAAVLSLA
jgi:pimeloyl-ACP methyl ester carboxylesterase